MKIINISVAILLSTSVCITPVMAENNFKVAESKINTNAYSNYQKGLKAYNLHTTDSYQQAIEFFDKALEISPEFAEAFATKSLAQSFLSYRLTQNEKPYNEVLKMAQINADTAFRINPNLSVVYNALSAIAKFQNNRNKAIEEANKAIKINPNDADAYFWRWYGSEQNTEDSNIQQALKLNPDMLIGHSELGTAFYNKRDFYRAINEYKKAISLNPEYPYAYNNLGSAYGQQEDFTQALYYFKKALEIGPEDVEPIRNISYLYEKSYSDQKKVIEKKELLDIYKTALNINPDSYTVSQKLEQLLSKSSSEEVINVYKELSKKNQNPKLNLKLADMYYKQDKLNDAIMIYEKVGQTNPELISSNKNLMMAYYKLDNIPKVIEYLKNNYDLDEKEILLDKSKKPEFHIKLGDNFYDNDDYKEAIIAYQKAIKLNPKSAEAHIKLGKAIDGIYDYEDDELGSLIYGDAIDEYAEAVRLEPNNLKYLSLLAGKYTSKENSDKAITMYKKILSIEPNNTDNRVKLADRYFYQGNIDEALIQYAEVLKKDKTNYQANTKLAEYNISKDNLSQAIILYKNALIKQPFNQDLHNRLGSVYQKAGRDKEAKKSFFEAKISPNRASLQYAYAYNDPEVHYQISNVYKSEGMINEAIFELKEAIRISPVHTGALRSLADMYQEQAKKIKAEGILLPLKKEVSVNPKNPKNYINLANGYKKIGDYDNAETSYKEAIKLNNTLTEAYNGLSDLYKLKAELENRKASEAERLSPYKNLIQSYSYDRKAFYNDHKAFYDAAINFKNQGKINEAIIGFQEAVKLDNYKSDYHYQLAECYQKINKIELANQEFKKACELGSALACGIIKNK